MEDKEKLITPMYLNTISGAQALIIIFICSSLLTRFNISFNLFFVFSFIYSIIYLFTKFLGKYRLKTHSLFQVLHYFLLCYLITIFLISKLVDINFNYLPHYWNGPSVLVLISVLMAHIVVLKTPNNHIIQTLEFIKKMSYFMIFESCLSFILPNSINIFISDFEAGYRFTSILTPGYILTGLFLILGYTSYLHLNRSKSKYKIFFVFLFFCFALIQTKDRTSILTFLVINLFVIYKNASSKVFILSIFKKITSFATLALMLTVVYFSMSTFGQRTDFMSISSVLNRYVLFVRGINVTNEVLPIGGGPGSQVRLMYSDKIPFNKPMYTFYDSSLQYSFNDTNPTDYSVDPMGYSIDYQRKRIGSERTISPHNTYIDYTISLGVLGILIVVLTLLYQFRSLLFIFSNQERHTYFLDAMFASIFVLLMGTSLINSMWLLIIMYSAHKMHYLQPNNKSNKSTRN